MAMIQGKLCNSGSHETSITCHAIISSMSRRLWITLVTRPQTLLSFELYAYGLMEELPKLLEINLNIRSEMRNGISTLFEDTASRKKLNEHIAKYYKENPQFLLEHLIEGR